MDEKRKEGYVTGLGCLVIFAIFLPSAINIGWNTTGQVFWVFTILFGGLGFGSLWKPDSVGAVTSQFLKNFAKSGEEESNSHNKQIQKKSSGSVQVMAHDNAQVHINVPSRKEKEAQKSPTEEKDLRKETIVASPMQGYSYEFELSKGDHVKGEISSTSPIDIYFLDSVNFDRWDRNKSFDSEDCNEAILETTIDYLVPKRGTWYLIIENNGRKSATVRISLY